MPSDSGAPATGPETFPSARYKSPEAFCFRIRLAYGGTRLSSPTYYEGVARFDPPTSVAYELTRSSRVGSAGPEHANLRGTVWKLVPTGEPTFFPPEGVVSALAFLHDGALRKLKVRAVSLAEAGWSPTSERAWYYRGAGTWVFKDGSTAPSTLDFVEDPSSERVTRYRAAGPAGGPIVIDFIEEAALRTRQPCPWRAGRADAR